MAHPQPAPTPQGPQWGSAPDLVRYAARVAHYHQLYQSTTRGQTVSTINPSPLETILTSNSRSYQPLQQRAYQLVQHAQLPQQVSEWRQRLQHADQLLAEVEANPQFTPPQKAMFRSALASWKQELTAMHVVPRQYLEPGSVADERREERAVQNAYNAHHGIPLIPEPTPPSLWERQKRNFIALGAAAALLLGASGTVPLFYESKLNPVPTMSAGAYQTYQLTPEELSARSTDGKSVMLNSGTRVIIRDGADGIRATTTDYTGDRVSDPKQIGWFITGKDGTLQFTLEDSKGSKHDGTISLNVAEDSGFLRQDNDADANVHASPYQLPQNIANLVQGFREISGAATPEEQKALTLSIALESVQPLQHGQFPYRLSAKTAEGKAIAHFDPRNGVTTWVDSSWLLAEHLHADMQDDYRAEGFTSVPYGKPRQSPKVQPTPKAKVAPDALAVPEPAATPAPLDDASAASAATPIDAVAAPRVDPPDERLPEAASFAVASDRATPYKTIRLPASGSSAGFSYQFTDAEGVAVSSGTITSANDGLESRIAPAAQMATFTVDSGAKGYRVHAVTYGDGRVEHVSKKKHAAVDVRISDVHDIYVSGYSKKDLREHSHRWWRNDSPKKDLEHGRMKKFKRALRDPAAQYDRLSAIARQDPEFTITHFTRADHAAGAVSTTRAPAIRIAFDHGMWDNFTKNDYHPIPQLQLADLPQETQTQLTQRFPDITPEELHIRPLVTINPKQAFAIDAPEGYQVTLLPLAAGSDSHGEFWHPDGAPVLWKKAGLFERLSNNQAEPLTNPKRLARAAEKPGKITADINPNNHKGMRKFHLKGGSGAYEIRVTDRQGSSIAEIPAIAQKDEAEAFMVQVDGKWYAIGEDGDGRTWVERT